MTRNDVTLFWSLFLKKLHSHNPEINPSIHFIVKATCGLISEFNTLKLKLLSDVRYQENF